MLYSKGPVPELVDLAEKDHVLAAHNIQAEWSFCELMPHDHPLDSCFEHQVRKLIEGAQNAHNLATVPELHQQPFVQLLHEGSACEHKSAKLNAHDRPAKGVVGA